MDGLAALAVAVTLAVTDTPHISRQPTELKVAGSIPAKIGFCHHTLFLCPCGHTLFLWDAPVATRSSGGRVRPGAAGRGVFGANGITRVVCDGFSHSRQARLRVWFFTLLPRSYIFALIS